MYGAQARINTVGLITLFENDVEMYGAQAIFGIYYDSLWFENDVEMYGAQAIRKELSCL